MYTCFMEIFVRSSGGFLEILISLYDQNRRTLAALHLKIFNHNDRHSILKISEIWGISDLTQGVIDPSQNGSLRYEDQSRELNDSGTVEVITCNRISILGQMYHRHESVVAVLTLIADLSPNLSH